MSGATLPTTDACNDSRQNTSTMDDSQGALSPIAARFHLRATQARWDLYHVVGKWVKVPAEKLGGSLTLGREGLPGLSHHKKPARREFAEAQRIIHHLR